MPLLGVLFLSIFSCEKADNTQTAGVSQTYLSIRDDAAAFHNGFLDEVYNTCPTQLFRNELDSVGINWMMDLGYSYFGSLGFTEEELNVSVAEFRRVQDEMLQKKKDGVPFPFEDGMEPKIRIVWDDIVEAFKDETSIEVATQQINAVLTNVLTDPQYTEEEKVMLANTVGIAIGSYAYWSENMDKWKAPDNVSRTVKQERLVNLVLADAGGFFTPAGLLGSAAFSALVAWSWD